MSSRPIASRTGVRVGAAALAAVVLVTGTVLAVTRPWEPPPGPPPCPPAAYQATQSVARRWDDALLDAIRRALPNPPVHARNLFHVSVAMWDAWAAYDPTAMGYLFKEKLNVDRCDVGAARNEAISYAAYRVLTARFIKAVGAEQSLSEFADLMDTLSYPTSLTTTDGDTPAAVGNRIAKTVLEYGLADGSNEANGYAAPNYKSVNPPLVVALPDIRIVDPNRWQPLQVEFLLSQNGVVLPSGVQTAVGPHWGHVTSFAIPPGGAEGVPFDPGPPPRLRDPTTDTPYKTQALEVIRDSSLLDVASDATVDIGPGAIGANALGSNGGHGYASNPATGRTYAPDIVRASDFYRTIAEFWADGPNSETPPGHWNVIANTVSDSPLMASRIGPGVASRLRWDVQMYFALNGALHDAAIAAWGLKRKYQSVRPISMIRYLAEHGQSSDPKLPSYDPEGLPLIPGLIELITNESSATGQRHAALADHVGEIAIRGWRGNPTDPHDVSGVGWILGEQWGPYQKATF